MVLFGELGQSVPLLVVVAEGSCPGFLLYLHVVDYLELGRYDADPIPVIEDMQIACLVRG